jgi:hypothetical protein
MIIIIEHGRNGAPAPETGSSNPVPFSGASRRQRGGQRNQVVEWHPSRREIETFPSISPAPKHRHDQPGAIPERIWLDNRGFIGEDADDVGATASRASPSPNALIWSAV